MEYHRPASLAAACALLGELGPSAMPLAGGTDLLVDLRRGAVQPRHLVSLADLQELQGIQEVDGELRIGALVTAGRMGDSPEIRSHRPELLDAVDVFGTPQVRTRATVGGSLCTAASCGDLAPLLLALDARVVLAGADGRREVPLGRFFQDHRETVVGPGRLLAEVVVPSRSPGEGGSYRAFGLRRANFITVAGVAAFLRLEGGVCKTARVTLGAVAPTPVPVEAAATILQGGPLTEGRIREASLAARDGASPISDVRGSDQHRKELVAVLCERALLAASRRAS